MPARRASCSADFRSLLGLTRGIYAPVFGALGAEGALAVGPRNPARGRLAARVGTPQPSIVKVEGVAPSCSGAIEGSGFVYAPKHVLTNAHVVAGVTQGPWVYAPTGPLPAQVVLYDPQRDLAVLYVPGLNGRGLRFAGPRLARRQADRGRVSAGRPVHHRAARVGAASSRPPAPTSTRRPRSCPGRSTHQGRGQAG